MTSERQAYVYVQLTGTLDTVPAALLKVEHVDIRAPSGVKSNEEVCVNLFQSMAN